MKKPRSKKVARYLGLEIGGVVFLVGLWCLLSFLVQASNPERGATILPSPIDVIRDFPAFATYSLAANGQENIWIAIQVIAQNTLISLARLLCGTLLGVMLGVTVGLLMATYDKVNKMLSPILMVLRTIPILALIPLFLAWFAGREEGNIIYITFAAFCMIVVNTIEATRNGPTVYSQYARTLGASRAQIFRTVTLPHIIPELIGGISVVIGMSWAFLLAAEYLAAQAGVGFMLIASERYLYTSKMVFIVLLLMALAILMNGIVLKIGKRITRWKPRIQDSSK